MSSLKNKKRCLILSLIKQAQNMNLCILYMNVCIIFSYWPTYEQLIQQVLLAKPKIHWRYLDHQARGEAI